MSNLMDTLLPDKTLFLAVQVAARCEASDDLTIDYRFDYTDSRTTGRAVQFLGTTIDGAGPLADGIIAFQGLTGGITNFGTKQLDAVANATSEEHLKVQGHNLSLQWDVSDVLTEIGRAHVGTPVTNAPLVCRLLLDKNTSHP